MYNSAKPDSLIEPKSPPLPLTASTCTGLPENGSASVILELVLPPPKFVILRSAPSRFERYRSRASSSPAIDDAFFSSHKSRRWITSVVCAIELFFYLNDFLCVGTGACHIACTPFNGHTLQIPALPECIHRIGRQSLAGSPLADGLPHVGSKRILQYDSAFTRSHVLCAAASAA